MYHLEVLAEDSRVRVVSVRKVAGGYWCSLELSIIFEPDVDKRLIIGTGKTLTEAVNACYTNFNIEMKGYA